MRCVEAGEIVPSRLALILARDKGKITRQDSMGTFALTSKHTLIGREKTSRRLHSNLLRWRSRLTQTLPATYFGA